MKGASDRELFQKHRRHLNKWLEMGQGSVRDEQSDHISQFAQNGPEVCLLTRHLMEVSYYLSW